MARGWRRRVGSPWILIVTGALLVVAVGAWQLYATWWTARSADAGNALVQRFSEDHALGAPLRSPEARAAGATASLASCRRPGATTPVHGLLEIPSLGVVAPVEQGDGDAVLSVAVGHDPHSSWPGTAGNAVLLAHDVSYFATIDRLASGVALRYVTPCTTYDFRVTSHAVVPAGAPVYDTPQPGLTLVTCWPTDALWFTPDRYLVTATEVSKEPTGGSPLAYVAASSPPTVPVPAPLAAQGVTLATYSLPMGTFTLTGSADPSWARTTSPLLASDSAVEAFIAGVRALGEGQLGWWHAIAPGVEPPAPLVGARELHYLSATEVTEAAQGSAARTVTLSDTISTSGGKHPGRYTMRVGTTVRRGTLTISSWRIASA